MDIYSIEIVWIYYVFGGAIAIFIVRISHFFPSDSFYKGRKFLGVLYYFLYTLIKKRLKQSIISPFHSSDFNLLRNIITVAFLR
jgi:hypothetical protein